jgi:Mlc titration factor MtfA (ptsG expression regulator)
LNVLTKTWRRLWRRPPLPAVWSDVVARRLPYLGLLTSAERDRLRALAARFLRDKNFEGAGGLRINDEIRSIIAAQACLLQLGMDGPLFPTLRTVIVYPGAYRVRGTEQRPEGVEVPLSQVRAGESWDYGTLLLSWRDVVSSAANPSDGRNVVLHEFAHQLDEETGEANGAPALPSRGRYASWHDVFQGAFERLRMDLAAGEHHGPLQPYAAKNPAEFFAVATEAFFERPVELQAYNPALFKQLVDFYQQDPTTRFT